MTERRWKNKPSAARFHHHLQRAHLLRRQLVDEHGLTPEHRLLSGWQAERLAGTYADFSVLPRYKPALDFFLTDLYGTRDFSRRDEDIERVYPLMARVLSNAALESLSLAVELHALTQELDAGMMSVLTAQLGVDPADSASLTREKYAEAYRRCDRPTARRRQIDLVLETGELLEQVTRTPWVYRAVRVARRPAHAAGFGELHDFIERGLAAFRHMKGAGAFLGAIRHRETFVLEQIYSGEPLTSWKAESFASPSQQASP